MPIMVMMMMMVVIGRMADVMAGFEPVLNLLLVG